MSIGSKDIPAFLPRYFHISTMSQARAMALGAGTLAAKSETPRSRLPDDGYCSRLQSSSGAKLVLTLLLLAPLSSIGQAIEAKIQPPSPVSKDQKAKDLIVRALAASGADWSKVTDFQVTASTSRWHGIDQTHTLTISGRPSGEYRLEVEPNQSERKYVEIQSGSLRTYSRGTDTPKKAPPQSSLSESIYFPLPYLYSILSDPQVELVYKGTSKLDDRVVEDIEVTKIYPSKDVSASYFNQFTKRKLSFDAQTGVLSNISYRAYTTKNALVSLPRSIEYRDYRMEQGIAFPHLIKQYQGSGLLESLSVTGIALNAGLPSELFQSIK
jgi:hypothetical protein